MRRWMLSRSASVRSLGSLPLATSFMKSSSDLASSFFTSVETSPVWEEPPDELVAGLAAASALGGLAGVWASGGLAGVSVLGGLAPSVLGGLAEARVLAGTLVSVSNPAPAVSGGELATGVA